MCNHSYFETFVKWLLRIFLIICTIFVLFPLVWMVLSSFKNQLEFMASPMSLPKVFRYLNFVIAWKQMDLSKYFINSMFLVFATVLLFFIMVSTTSYIIAKYQFRFKKVFETFYFVSMMIPTILTITSMYFLFESLNMTDSLISLVLIYSSISVPGAVLLVVGFMRNINNAFTEAAVIDGANEFQIFSMVIIPLVRPVLFFICVGNIMGTWNDYTIALTFVSSPSKYPVSIGLHFMEQSVSDKGIVFAGLVIALIPILIVYGAFQKQIQEGVSADSGVKG